MMGPGPGIGGGYSLDEAKGMEQYAEALDKINELYKELGILKAKNKKLKKKNKSLKKENKELRKVLEYNIYDAFNDLKKMESKPSEPKMVRPKPLPREVKLGLDNKTKRELQRARERRNNEED